MKRQDGPEAAAILPVPRTREEAQQTYDRLSRFYDYTIGGFGQKYARMALQRLSIAAGETVLETGFGTGRCLKLMAELAGRMGRVYGIDISPGMMAKARNRLERAGPAGRVGLLYGDAAYLPFGTIASMPCS